MREFQERKKQQANLHRFLSSKWTLIFFLILLILLIKGNIRIFKNYLHVKEKYNQDLQYYEDLKKRELELNRDIERLKTEDGLDYLIRKKLDVSRENERVIKIIDKQQ